MSNCACVWRFEWSPFKIICTYLSSSKLPLNQFYFLFLTNWLNCISVHVQNIAVIMQWMNFIKFVFFTMNVLVEQNELWMAQICWHLIGKLWLAFYTVIKHITEDSICLRKSINTFSNIFVQFDDDLGFVNKFKARFSSMNKKKHLKFNIKIVAQRQLNTHLWVIFSKTENSEIIVLNRTRYVPCIQNFIWVDRISSFNFQCFFL